MKKYPELENLVKIAQILKKIHIPYYITDGLAVSIYGHPRSTADIDIVIKMLHSNIKDFSNEFRGLFNKGYVDEVQIRNALLREGEFNIIDPESGIKIDFFIVKDNVFEKQCFDNIIVHNIDFPVNFISPEDLIISKLIWYREGQSTKHIEDIKSIIETQNNLNKKYLNHWIKKLSLEQEWQKINS